jgi:putative membrane protein
MLDDPAIDAFTTAWPAFMLFGAVALLLWVAAIGVYVGLTPHKEFALVRAGNSAAAVSLAAMVVGMAIPLAMALGTSTSLIDLVIWGVLGLVLQLLAFRVVDMILRDLPKRIADGEMAAAILLAGVKTGAAVLTAAAMGA